MEVIVKSNLLSFIVSILHDHIYCCDAKLDSDSSSGNVIIYLWDSITLIVFYVNFTEFISFVFWFSLVLLYFSWWWQSCDIISQEGSRKI